jgi:hypothetical protein
MTDHHPQTSHPGGLPPTARQQNYLRQLALERGVTFVVPTTRSEASRLIDELKRRAPEPIAERRREIRAVQDDLATTRQTANSGDPNSRTSPVTATWKGARS